MFQATFARGVTLNSKEENSQDFFPDYVQEFGLCTDFISHIYLLRPFVCVQYCCSTVLPRAKKKTYQKKNKTHLKNDF
jgi:hypothetical protein